MTGLMSERSRWLIVVLFAVGMAWVEAASVYYLRVMVDRVEPYQQNPLPVQGALGAIELVREAATLVMLLTVGALAGKTAQARLGYTAIAFGVWDILYYVFLRIMTGWPRSLLDWDILFLLPLPWWGPVLAPVGIAALMIAAGTLASQYPARATWTRTAWGVSGLGIAVALYVFMADALVVAHQGVDATRQVLPQTFNWPLYAVAFGLMAAPLVQCAWGVRPSRAAAVARSQ